MTSSDLVDLDSEITIRAIVSLNRDFGAGYSYDVLLEEFDPDVVKMQFQVAVFNIGYLAADYFRKYPGRFWSAHRRSPAAAPRGP